MTFRQSNEYLKLAGETKLEGVTEKVRERVTENQKRILEEIIRNKYITIKRLSESIGISERKTQENINKLKGKRLLERVGPDKGGYWEILSE